MRIWCWCGDLIVGVLCLLCFVLFGGLALGLFVYDAFFVGCVVVFVLVLWCMVVTNFGWMELMLDWLRLLDLLLVFVVCLNGSLVLAFDLGCLVVDGCRVFVVYLRWVIVCWMF